jgi:predicted restriction endonuclease
MSKWEFIRPFIPEIWGPRGSRNQVKSKHIDNIERLRSDRSLHVNFLEDNEATLGLATNSHYRVKNLIEAKGYLDDGEYVIHDSEDQKEIKKLINSVVWRIRITNFASILLWILFAVTIIVLIGVVTSVISRVIFEFITNWVSLTPSQ